jgi:hypothetical protein
MKLAVPYIEICEVPDALITGMLDVIAEEDWFVKDYRKSFSNLGASESILLRHSPLCGDGQCQTNDRAIEDLKYQPLYEKFAAVFEPFLDILRDHYAFNEYAAFITRMPGRSEIGMHGDGGNFLTKCHRIHFPLQTNPDVAYCIDNQEYYWQRGKAYEFDNTRIHGVKNRSDQIRIHLIINLYNLKLQK